MQLPENTLVFYRSVMLPNEEVHQHFALQLYQSSPQPNHHREAGLRKYGNPRLYSRANSHPDLSHKDRNLLQLHNSRLLNLQQVPAKIHMSWLTTTVTIL